MVRFLNRGVVDAVRFRSATVARTNTNAKNLFSLPANAVILGFLISSPAASNAGDSAALTIGKTGTENHFIATHDVKTAATGAGLVLPNGVTNAGSVGSSDIQVVGKYAEAGAASNTGGPWTVVCLYQA